jgi:acetolactate synthase-1/2/3 large subunit
MSLAGLAAMGSGVAAVIGGKLARPDRPAICVCGDGDLQMHGMEIATATSYGLPVIWLVLENGMLGMIKDVQVSSYRNRRIAHTFFQPDLVKLAEALGGIGLRAVAPGEVRAAVEAALSATGPVVIAVPIDPDEMPPTKPRMLAIERSMGLPPVSESLSLGGIRALWTMFHESGGLRRWLSRRRRR